MQVESNNLFVTKEGVTGVPLEVVLDLLDRVGFWRVSGKAFEVEPWKCSADRIDGWPFVNSASIPEQDDMSAQVLKQHAQELGHGNGLKIVLPELNIQAHAGALGRNRECRDRRNAVMLLVVPNTRRMSPRIPSTTTRRDEHEATLIKEGDVGSKSSGFFL